MLNHEQKRIANRLNIDDSSDDKKAKDTKKYIIKGKLKFENYKNCAEATQLENKTSHLGKKNKINIYSFIKNHKQFIRNNKSILKHSKDLKVKGIMFLLKKLIRLF